jgi:hypothetical protein
MESRISTRTLIMTDLRRRTPTTPRLVVVGLIVFIAACHRQQPTTSPAPAPSRPAAPPSAATAISSAPTLIRALHDRYASAWFHTLTFTQKTTVRLPSGGEIVQTYYESLELPGKLRIDTDIGSKSGILFTRDSSFRFSAGKLVGTDTLLNELMVLGFDLYTQPIARTETMLRRLGFDLSRFHESTWQGKPVYVVGALRGDTTSKQFYVDRDRLLFLRVIESNPRGRADTRYSDYVQYGGGWVATQVEQYVNGRRTVLEQYSGVKVNPPISGALFDPKQWSTAPHWARK